VTASIAAGRLIDFRLPLRRPWRFGEHTIHSRSGWLIGVRDEVGVEGWGEATPFPEIGTEDPQHCRRWLEHRLPELPGLTPDQALDRLGDGPPAGRCGLECALLDLKARRAGLPLGCLLHPTASTGVAVNAALGPLGQVGVEDLATAADNGYTLVKLKLGTEAPSVEAACLRELCRNLPAGMRLRLDANRAWDGAQARRVLPDLDPERVQMVEEPLATDDLAAWQALRAVSPVPLAMDESLSPEGLDPVLDSGALDWLVLKPMRFGGLLPCLAIAERAQRRGVRCVVTTTLDGALGVAVATQLAAVLDARYGNAIHGLATSELLSSDLADPYLLARGSIRIPDRPGLGLIPTHLADRTTNHE